MRYRHLAWSLLLIAAPSLGAAPAAYESAFAAYRPYQEPQVAPWKETNDKIGKTSGHGGHAGHDMSGTASAPKVPPPAKPAKPDPHAGHKH